MNFTDFFTRGLANTLKFKNQANFSYKGTAVVVNAATVVDTWYLQDFTTANYEITVEYGVDDVEHINAVVSARANQASITVYGRTNLGRDLVQFSTSVDNSVVKLIATPFYEIDDVTLLKNIRVIFKVTYSERITRLTVPTINGETTTAGGEFGQQLNWNNSNLPNGFLQITENGQIEISTLSNIAVSGQSTLVSKFILDSLAITNTDGGISITTNSSTRTLTFTAVNYPSIAVTGSFTSTITGNTNTMDNTIIGGITPRGGNFTNLSATGLVALQPLDNNVTISPSGTGKVIISPIIQSNIDSVVIGSVTPAAGKFTSLTLTNPVIGGNNLATVAAVKQQLLLGAIQ